MAGFVFLSFSMPLSADTVVLKTGEKIEGRIVGKGSDMVIIRTKEGSEDIHYLKDVETVKESAGVEKIINPGPASRAALVSIPIHPMIELDYKTKAEIYELRKKLVAEHEDLRRALQLSWVPAPMRGAAEKFLKPYEPNNEIFTQVEDKKPWWGIQGFVHYGNGQNSIAGASEESRFLGNPYLLAGIDFPTAYVVPGQTLEEVYPQPTALMWSTDAKQAQVQYNITKLWQEQIGYHHQNRAELRRMFDLRLYNAHDLGFDYFYLIPDDSKNIVSGNSSSEAVYLKQFIHCGGSCGYPGGCNNMSPTMPEMNVTITELPATAAIGFWRKKPGNVNQKPDMIFTIQLV